MRLVKPGKLSGKGTIEPPRPSDTPLVEGNSRSARLNLVSNTKRGKKNQILFGFKCSFLLVVCAFIYNFIASSNFPPKTNSTIFCKVENLTSFVLFSTREMYNFVVPLLFVSSLQASVYTPNN